MLTVAIFSFNRGEYLANCVHSVLRNIPDAVVKVYDDNSTDPETVAVLKSLAVAVILPENERSSRHGGLYGNMQAALDEAATDLILFLQDDMQIVRLVDASEVQGLAASFGNDEAQAFLFPGFIKHRRISRYRRLVEPFVDARLRCYRLPGQPKHHQLVDKFVYADVSIGHVPRLRAVGWTFRESEEQNREQARQKFSEMPILGDPFAFFCPEVPVFRYQHQSLAGRLAVRVTGEGVKRYIDMTSAETLKFRHRDLSEWPLAEDFLKTENPRIRRPYVYKDVNARWWLSLLHKVETWLMRGGRG